MRILYEFLIEAASIDPMCPMTVAESTMGSESVDRAKVRLTREQLEDLAEQLRGVVSSLPVREG